MIKFILHRATALNAFLQLLKTADTKAKGKIFSEFVFSVDNNELKITSMNERSEQSIVIETLKLESDGKEKLFAANAQQIVDYIKLFPDTEIGGYYDDEKSVFTMGSKTRASRFALPTFDLSEDNISDMRMAAKGIPFTLTGEDLSKAFRCTAFAASTNPADTPKTAVRLLLQENGLIAEAMDNYRLSRYTHSFDEKLDSTELLIPRETAEALGSMLEDCTDDVTLHPGVSHIKATWGDTVYISRLEASMGKKFPEISKILGGTKQAEVKVSKAELQRSLATAGLVSKDTFLEFNISDDGLTVSCEEDEKGESADTIVAQASSGSGYTHVGWKHAVKAINSTTEPWTNISFVQVGSNGLLGMVVEEGDYSHMLIPVLPTKLKDNEEGSED